jgi:hypothetical protein
LKPYVLVTEFDAVANVLVFCVGNQFVEKVFLTCLESFTISGNLCSFFQKEKTRILHDSKKTTYFCNQNCHISMKTYDTQEDKKTAIASEPAVTYGNLEQAHCFQGSSLQDIPFGCMTLERFGELFHQKLDAYYAELQGDSQQ